MTAQELLREIESLPVEQRLMIVDHLLRGLAQANPAIDHAWVVEAERRLEEILSGREKAIPGEEVFDDIRRRFAE